MEGRKGKEEEKRKEGRGKDDGRNESISECW